MGIPLEISLARFTGHPHHDRPSPLYRETPPETFYVCPHCLCEVTAHRFMAPDGVWITAHSCQSHGDVIPIRSAVRNRARPAAEICTYCRHPLDRHFVGCRRPKPKAEPIDWSAA